VAERGYEDGKVDDPPDHDGRGLGGVGGRGEEMELLQTLDSLGLDDWVKVVL
jgi:hypothetical protein